MISKYFRKAILFHLKDLEDALSENKDGGPFLFGEKFTMADVGWVSILDRMDATRWWSIVDRNEFPKGILIQVICDYMTKRYFTIFFPS